VLHDAGLQINFNMQQRLIISGLKVGRKGLEIGVPVEAFFGVIRIGVTENMGDLVE